MLEKCPLLRNSNKKLSRRNKEALKAEKTAGDGASFHNGVLKHNRIVFFLKSSCHREKHLSVSLFKLRVERDVPDHLRLL